MTSPIKPWLSQQEAQRLLCELADANLDAAQRKRERDILQHALDEATARIAEREAWRSRAEKRQNELAAWINDHAAYIATEQKHLDDGSTQQAYWHYGYLIALRDLLSQRKP